MWKGTMVKKSKAGERKGFSAYELHRSVSSTPQLSLDIATYHEGHRLRWYQPSQLHGPHCCFTTAKAHPIRPAPYSTTLKIAEE